MSFKIVFLLVINEIYFIIIFLERMRGIEPPFHAWQAYVITTIRHSHNKVQIQQFILLKIFKYNKFFLILIETIK